MLYRIQVPQMTCIPLCHHAVKYECRFHNVNMSCGHHQLQKKKFISTNHKYVCTTSDFYSLARLCHFF